MGPVSDQSQPSRPSQVTLAGWLSMVGSALVVVLVFDQLAGLHTLETRATVEKFLSEPPGSDLGVDADGILALMRTAAMVAAGCATAAAILGYQVLRRSRSARMALTVVAVPLFLAGLVTGGFVSTMVAASAVMLWMRPARDWFDGVTRPAPAAFEAPTAGPPAPPPAAPADPPTATHVPQVHSAPAHPSAFGAPYAAAPGAARVQDPSTRPGAVAVACALTWITSGLTVLGLGLTGLLLALQPDTLLDEVHRQNPDLAQQGVTDQMLVGVTYAMLAAIGLWCLAAIVLGILAFRGAEWARILLVVSAATAAALSLVGTVVGAFLLLGTLVASAVTIGLLVRPDVRAWFSARSSRSTPAGADPPR